MIRTALVKDVRLIAQIHVSAWQTGYKDIFPARFLASLSVTDKEQFWKKTLQNPGKGQYIVYENAQGIKAFAVFGPARDADLAETSAELVALNVCPQSWRQGIGKKLALSVIAETKNQHYKALFLWVVKDNLKAIRLYEQLGFCLEGKIKRDIRHTGEPLTEIRYSKKLVHA